MFYLSQMLGKPVVDATGTEIGTINDIAIATGEVFPRVTSLAFLGPDKTPFMLSWRKYVDTLGEEEIRLNVPAPEIRFSYLQPDEVLLHRDLLNKQIVDTQGMKVVRVNDLKLSESRNQLRLLGAEVGLRGVLRGISPALERAVDRLARLVRAGLPETIIAWNYMDLLDRDLSQVKLSVTHKRLHELHPADVADILEQLTAAQRAAVFTHLDNERAAETISELEDEFQADVIDDLSERRASDLLAEMDPDDAADIIGDLPYDKAERLLRLMGVEDAGVIRGLLGYKEKTAGGIMTPEITTVTESMTVHEVIEHLRAESAEHESIYYVYVVEGDRHLNGVISLRDLLLSAPDTTVAQIAERDLFTASPDDDQEDVAEQMSKYDLLALPVIDEQGRILGIVTVDDALDVLEEESAEDLALATGNPEKRGLATGIWWWFGRRSTWLLTWAVIAVGALALLREATAGPWSTLLLPALVFLPLPLRIAEDVSQRSIAEVIEVGDELAPVWRRVVRDGLLGVAFGVVAGVFTSAAVELVSSQEVVAAVFGAVTTLAVIVVAIAGVWVTQFAKQRADAEKRVSGTALGLLMMVVGTAVYLGLAVAGGYVITMVAGA